MSIPKPHPQPPPRRGRLVRAILIVIGWTSIITGVIGIFLPVLPTVPFLLLASACFAESSPRFHAWLIHHPRLGPPIQDWQQHGRIRPRAKILAIASMSFSYGILWFFTSMPTPGRVILGLIMGAVAIRILRAPSH